MKKLNYEFYKILFYGSIVFLTIGLLPPVVVKFVFSNLDYTEIGPIGDWLGGTSTPFINSASFFILLAAYLLQTKELKETRDIFIVQNETLVLQRFENTFFQLISIHNQIVTTLIYDPPLLG